MCLKEILPNWSQSNMFLTHCPKKWLLSVAAARQTSARRTRNHNFCAGSVKGILRRGEGTRPPTETYWVSMNSSFAAPQHSWKKLDQIPKNCLIENLKVKIQNFKILRSMVLQFNNHDYFYNICLEIFK